MSYLDLNEKKILKIAEDIINRNQFLTLEGLFLNSKKALSYLNEKEISNAIYNLILKDKIIDREFFTRDKVLENENRKKIFDIILNNPSLNIEKICVRSGLSRFIVILHLEILQKFGFIYEKIIQGNTLFFPNESPTTE